MEQTTYASRLRYLDADDVELGLLYDDVAPLRGVYAGPSSSQLFVTVEITREAYQDYRGRFHLDPHLPSERADAFYVEWARQCLNGAMADQMLRSAWSTVCHWRRSSASCSRPFWVML